MKQVGSQKRKSRVRYKLASVSKGKHRISVHRSNQHIYVQLIDDKEGKTLAAASSLNVKENLPGMQMAEKVGALFAEKVKKTKVDTFFFDRGSRLYHGCIKALADSARANGLNF